MDERRSWWARQKAGAQVGIILGVVVGVLVLVGIGAAIGAGGSGDEESSADARTVTDTVTVTAPAADAEAAPTTEAAPATTEQATTTEAAPATTEQAPPPPRAIVREGIGAKVVSVNVPDDGPLVVEATHQGASNFVIELVGGGGNELLVNEIGSYDGATLAPFVAAGRARIAVTADGSWRLRLTQPVPSDADTPIPGAVSGRGDDVIALQSTEDLQPIVQARHRGNSNFIASLYGFGDTSGEEFLFNEIGNYTGETLLNDLPEGHFLLAVNADGAWTVRFRP